MIIKYHKKFTKKFNKLATHIQNKVLQQITLFTDDPYHPNLNNHALHGPMNGRRAISVTGDIRIIFEEHDHYTLVLMLDVGTHSQVY